LLLAFHSVESIRKRIRAIRQRDGFSSVPYLRAVEIFLVFGLSLKRYASVG